MPWEVQEDFDPRKTIAGDLSTALLRAVVRTAFVVGFLHRRRSKTMSITRLSSVSINWASSGSKLSSVRTGFE